MAGSPERLKPRHIAVQGLRILLLRVVDELREIITAALSIRQDSEQDVLVWRRQMTNQSLRERFGLSEGSGNTVSAEHHCHHRAGFGQERPERAGLAALCQVHPVVGVSHFITNRAGSARHVQHIDLHGIFISLQTEDGRSGARSGGQYL